MTTPRHKELKRKYNTLGMSIHLWIIFIESWIKYPKDSSRRHMHQYVMSGLSYRDRS